MEPTQTPQPTQPPAKEPVKTNKTGDPGRPDIAETQYMDWLILMQPYLRAGNTLWYAMDKCDLLGHSFVIYEKYKSKDWFSKKIDALRATPGELVNNTMFLELERISRKVKEQLTLTREEIDILKFMGERHRTSQPFFVNRQETAVADESKVGKILDTIEQSDYDDVGREAKKQMVAVDAPVQNQGQTGAVGNVQT